MFDSYIEVLAPVGGTGTTVQIEDGSVQREGDTGGSGRPLGLI